MKKYILIISSIFISSCASTGISTPPEFTLSPDQQCKNTNPPICDTRFNSNYMKLKNLHDNLRLDATSLAREGTALNGITAIAATSTLAFAGFKAHPDNILVSTIVGGVGGATTTQLKPIQRAQFRIRGMSALSCIAGKADTFRDLTDRSNQRLNAGLISAGASGYLPSLNVEGLTSYTASTVSGRSSYDVLDDLLYLFLTTAQHEPDQTDALKTTIPVAQQSRTKLAMGIKAQNDAFSSMSNAIEIVRIAINKETPPSLTALVEAISKVELPQAPVTPTAGSTGAGKGIMTRLGITASSDDLALILGFLASKVDQLTPELDATTVRGMTACVAELSASN